MPTNLACVSHFVFNVGGVDASKCCIHSLVVEGLVSGGASSLASVFRMGLLCPNDAWSVSISAESGTVGDRFGAGVVI